MPSISFTGAGSGASATLQGSDLFGAISFMLGSSPTSNPNVFVDFGLAYMYTAQSVRVVPANAAAVALNLNNQSAAVGGISGGQGFRISLNGISANTEYSFAYVIG